MLERVEIFHAPGEQHIESTIERTNESDTNRGLRKDDEMTTAIRDTEIGCRCHWCYHWRRC